MRKEIINSDLIDYFRKNTSTIFCDNLGNEENEIVPKQLEHWHLINSNNIDKSIYRYYHYPTRKMLTQIEFDEIKKIGFAGRKETAIKPYSIVFCGAYHFLPNFLNKLSSIAFLDNKYKPKINGKTITSIYDLKPYFEEYAKGFEKGFNYFETDEIKPFLTLISEKQDYVFKVFDYVTKSIIFRHGWATSSSGFTQNGLENGEIIKAFENGKKEGYFYKAWSIILSNNNLFAPLFEDFLKEDHFSVSYSSDNSIEFRNQKKVFPFPVSDLFRLITSLRETILKEDVCAVDLQEYPDKIFKETDLKNYPDLSAYIYNIIEVWVTEIEISLHNGNKKRLFDSFLKLCEDKAITNISNETREQINNDVFNYLSTLSKEEIEDKIQNAETLKRLCEISIEYSKNGSWSVGNLPIEFDAITKVDLFVENFTKSIEILAKEGKDVNQLIDLFIQTTKTNLENPLLDKNVKINRHLFNKLEGVKLLLPNVKALPPQQKQEAESQINTLKNEIESAFSFMQHNDPRKHKRVVNDDDFDSLIKWVTYYFENNFTIPEIDEPIKVINTNKGNVVYTFIKIFKDLHPTKTRPESLFELIKLCFNEYRNDNISNYKKQKEPQYYSQLVNKK